MALEFCSIGFVALSVIIVSTWVRIQNQSFKTLLDKRMKQLEVWCLKLEMKGQGYHLSKSLYSNITHFIKDAFEFDFNMVIEEYHFYYNLTPRMQTKLVHLIFNDFLEKFDNFFGLCEQGFANEFVVNMYTRRYRDNSDIMWYG